MRNDRLINQGQALTGTEFPYHGQLLLVEYNSAKLYALSLCIQAIIDRRGAVNGFTTDFTNLAGYGADDLHAINDVVDSATEVLTTAVHLADAKVLGNSPARMTFRVISASIFLLKSLGLGVGAAKLQTSLETIQRVITALRNSAIDEMSLGARYASLLEMHLSRLQNSFVTSTAPHGLEAQMGAGFGGDSQAESGTFQYFGNTQEGWFSLPFDETLVSTDFVDLQGFSNFDDNDLNFLWNLNYAQSNTGAV